MAMIPKGIYFANLASIAAATAASFLVSAVFLRGATFDDQALSNAQEASRANKGVPAKAPDGVLTAASDLSPLRVQPVHKVVFACDAGMGSSAMGATGFRKEIEAAGLPITVTNTAIENIPADADVVATQQNLTSRAVSRAPGARHVSIDNFVGNPIYDRMVEELKAGAGTTALPTAQVAPPATPVSVAQLHQVSTNTVLRRENIVLGLPSVSRDEARRFAGRGNCSSRAAT